MDLEIKTVKLGNKNIGRGQPVFVICEGGVTNYGQLDLAKKQVDAAVAAKADAVKFQAWRTEQLVSKKVSARLETELGYDWFNRVKEKEMSFDEIKELFAYARERGIAVFATAHDDESLDFLDEEMNQPLFKIGSGEAHNLEFLRNVGRRGKPVIISFGLQSEDEARAAMETLKSAGAKEIIALHCVTAYPTPYEMANLGRMKRLGDLLEVPAGISDHTVGWHAPLGAVVLGAVVVEKHLTFDKNDPRSLDNAGALLPDEFALMVKQIRDMESALRNIPEDERLDFLSRQRDWAGQSLVAAGDLIAGTILTREMIAFKRPSKGGLPPEMAEKLCGKRIISAIAVDEQIKLEHFE
ncbi:N-acetylneuraminate synthase family protein [Candidatus Uhrbacteria bacterium]|nr:N-acetylneuraminate synthase family protein [Candidatus Uhrbacteria bacterium]